MHVSLLSWKKFGNLLVPSTSTYKVVKVTDSVVRAELCIWQNLCNETNVKITAKVLQKTRNETFESISQHSKETHMLDGQFRDCHKTTLIKLIVKNYLILFYHQFYYYNVLYSWCIYIAFYTNSYQLFTILQKKR